MTTPLFETILQSTSLALFPADMGMRRIQVDTAGSDGDTPLHILVRRDDAIGVKCLLMAGAKVNAAGDMRETPLHIAALQSSVEVVELLLQHAANPDLLCDFGDTARHRGLAREAEIARLFKSTRFR